jgi:eukaryotic-like serine/threonine-protein kinase
MTQFGKYDLLERLGSGRYGNVYRALDQTLDREVALKLLKPEWSGDLRFIQQFQREAKTAAKIEHANVVGVYEVGEQDGRWFIAMQYMPGGSLHDRLEDLQNRDEVLSIDQALEIGLEIGLGLAAIHKRDLVHCDLKPSNILFDADGHARVGDLGLTRSFTASRSSLTGTSTLHAPGTPAYMSPEQETGAPHLRPPADVYALGLVLFEMLTGRSYKNQEPGTKLSALRENSPAWLDELLASMLAEDWHQRLWSGEKAAVAIQPCLELARAAALMPSKGKKPAGGEPENAPQVPTVEPLPRAVPDPTARITSEPRLEIQEKEPGPCAQEESSQKANETLHAAEPAPQETGQKVFTLAPGVEMVFVCVPEGEFWMGNDPKEHPQADPDEQPKHTVWLDTFWVAKSPVTNRQFAAFTQSREGERVARLRGWRIPPGKEEHPVVSISWDEAAAFCAWLEHTNGHEICLPTEAEWEKAARGTDSHIFPWGSQSPDARRCNFNQIVKDTTSVGKYSPDGDSPYGCVDMAGNVWEWIQDWYDSGYYARSPRSSPGGPEEGEQRILRGGSWNNNTWSVRAGNRNKGYPGNLFNLIGFRPVLFG